MKTVALTFHVETLEDDRTSQRLRIAAKWLARVNVPATLFVDPFQPQRAGRDIRGYLAGLSTLGHEIGQHTHFFNEARISSPSLRDDRTENNLQYCLRRDHGILSRSGALPAGFVGGAWVVNDRVLDILIELGFTYDCSTRLRVRAREECSDNPYHRWNSAASLHSRIGRDLVCLPTTGSIGEWMKQRRWRRRVDAPGRRELVYLHDYDLRHGRYWLLLLSFVAMQRMRGAGFRSARELAREIHDGLTGQ